MLKRQRTKSQQRQWQRLVAVLWGVTSPRLAGPRAVGIVLNTGLQQGHAGDTGGHPVPQHQRPTPSAVASASAALAQQTGCWLMGGPTLVAHTSVRPASRSSRKQLHWNSTCGCTVGKPATSAWTVVVASAQNSLWWPTGGPTPPTRCIAAAVARHSAT